ncbi:MAG: hypothetical protein WA777_00775, partial [Rhodanobacter sp.]
TNYLHQSITFGLLSKPRPIITQNSTFLLPSHMTALQFTLISVRINLTSGYSPFRKSPSSHHPYSSGATYGR